MNLQELLKAFTSVDELPDLEIDNLELDSRDVVSGTLFFAVKGEHFDGTQFISNAIERGAVAILVESPSKAVVFENKIPVIPVLALQKKMGDIAAKFYSYPTKAMDVIGVTGTNGKTSVCYLLAQVLGGLNKKVAVIGTLGNGDIRSLKKTSFTTPFSIALQKQFAEFKKEGFDAVVMEVSSHALDQGRTNAIEFDYAVFTNLSRDHLDYHETMEAYGAAKKRLFSFSSLKAAVINVDDPFGKAFSSELPETLPVCTYSTNEKGADVIAYDIHFGAKGISSTIQTEKQNYDLRLPLLGGFNLSNTLAVFSVLSIMKVDLNRAIQNLSHVQAVPGRMQMISRENYPTAIVDFAHTPDALEKALKALKAHASKDIVCVFGCGGDRDRGKRPMMAKIAEAFSDQIIITNDNPRSESPEQITEDILVGLANKSHAVVELDRKKAIEKAITESSEHAMVLIAGKGHETTQTIGQDVFEFSDLDVVKSIMNKGK
jgi:UDP-N-acetylmuramoyl-L-alanyl-D-glutamate--2,6-diaminopimelate ligase